MEELILFTPQTHLIPIEELFELTGNDAIEILGDSENPSGYRITWQDVSVIAERVSSANFAKANDDLQALVAHVLGDRTDSKAQKHIRRIEVAHQALRIGISPYADDAGKAKNVILGMVTFYEGGFLRAGNALYNDAGKRFFGEDDTRPRYFREIIPDDSEEAKSRKENSLKRLNIEKVPVIKHLPVITDSTQASTRTPEMIAQRLIALVLIAEKAEGASVAEYEEKLNQHGIREHVTPDEWAFAHEDEPIKQDIIKFSQRFESAWVLAWALGFVPTLGRPDAFCDVDVLRAGLAKNTVATWVQTAQPIAISTLLDETDLIFRYHWAVNDAELYGTRIPAKLIPAVTYERHYALRWLTAGEDWDKVNTDT